MTVPRSDSSASPASMPTPAAGPAGSFASHDAAPMSHPASVPHNDQMPEDRFATGARMEASVQAPTPSSPVDHGIVADPASVFAGEGYRFPPPPANRPAQFALWLAVAGVLFPFALVGSVGGGIWGLIHAHYNHGVGRRQSIAALVVSFLSGFWWLFLYAAVSGMLPSSL